MGVLGIILLTLGFIGMIITYTIVAATMNMWAHTLLILYLNSKKTLRRMVKPHIQVKAYDLEYNWEKTEFGDFETAWKFVDQSTRTYSVAKIYFDKYGNITHMADDKWSSDMDILKKVCHDGIDINSIIKSKF